MNYQLDYEIVELRTVKQFSRGANAVMVLRGDGTRQAYVSLPFKIKQYKKNKTIIERIIDLLLPYKYIAHKSEIIKIKKNRLKKLFKRPDYGYIYWLKGLFRPRHVDLVFSEPNTLYPVLTEGFALQQYARYVGELKVGMWWD